MKMETREAVLGFVLHPNCALIESYGEDDEEKNFAPYVRARS